MWLNHPNEDDAMSSSPPEDAENTKREQRQRSIRIIVGLFNLMLGVPPLLNALGNPRVQTLHTPDVMGLIAFNVDNKPDSTGLFFIPWIVKTLLGR